MRPRSASREARLWWGPGELPPTNVPEPTSELIAREEELTEIVSLSSPHRLVTLTGAGGIGKTRLALAAARPLLPQFADGVWLVEFSAIADPGLVPATVAAASGSSPAAGRFRRSAWRRRSPAGGCCWCWTPAST